ncbi:MAG: hypothetical protein KGZ58_12495 [Ignavibacteriales bacterium]|nr:hypothetical protein [Ignavibacteriales bacterium]
MNNKKKNLKCKSCGCSEFVTKPNQYEVYEVIDDNLKYTHSETVDEETRLFCRDCSKELKNADELISA